MPPTPALPLFEPLPHPETECPFYRGGWQNFLVATQPDENHAPDFLSWPTIDTVFESSKPHPADRSKLGDIKQAGGRQILIDQNGNPIVYGIHVNQAYADFIMPITCARRTRSRMPIRACSSPRAWSS